MKFFSGPNAKRQAERSEELKKKSEVAKKSFYKILITMERKTLFEEIERLPPEILKMILDMLPLSILLQLQNTSSVRDNGINKLSLDVKHAVFEDTPPMSLCDIKNYINVRTSYITMLNLNNFNHNPQHAPDICELIISCVKLRVLSVKNCHLNDRHIYEIFLALVSIEELEWTVLSDESSKIMMITEQQFSLKKLSLDITDKIGFTFAYNFFLKSCPLLEEIYFKLGEIRSSLRQFSDSRELNLLHLNSLTVTYFIQGAISGTAVMNAYNTVKMFERAKPVAVCWKKFWIDIPDSGSDFEGFNLDDIDPTISVVSLPGDVTWELSNRLVFPHSVKAVKFRIWKFLFSEQVHWLKSCCKTNLKFLSVEGLFPIFESLVHFEGIQATREDVSSLFETCRNITVLQLHVVHFELSVCSALSQLKGLKHLCLDTCALTCRRLQTSESAKEKTEHEQDLNFSDVIKSCPLVVEFTLHACKNNDYINDEDLAELHHWSRLECLSLNNLSMLRTCSFLGEIAVHCVRFKRLELIHTGERFPVPAVTNMLQYAKSLTYLGIRHQDLQVPNLFVESNMRHAKALETLCFYSAPFSQETAITAAQSFRLLRNLHTIHLMYVTACPFVSRTARTFRNLLASQHVHVEIVKTFCYRSITSPCDICRFKKNLGKM